MGKKQNQIKTTSTCVKNVTRSTFEYRLGLILQPGQTAELTKGQLGSDYFMSQINHAVKIGVLKYVNA